MSVQAKPSGTGKGFPSVHEYTQSSTNFLRFSDSISFISFVLGNANLIECIGQLLRVGCNYTHTHTKYRKWNIE